jgi:hypothetical protein
MRLGGDIWIDGAEFRLLILVESYLPQASCLKTLERWLNARTAFTLFC